MTVPLKPNEVWSADFMSNALYGGSRCGYVDHRVTPDSNLSTPKELH